MDIAISIIAALVGIEFLYIMYLETFATASAATSRTFGISQAELQRDSLAITMRNQGVYNGLIGVGVLLGAFAPGLVGTALLPVLLVGIVLVAAYGGLTVTPSVFPKQAGLAIITLALIAARALM